MRKLVNLALTAAGTAALAFMSLSPAAANASTSASAAQRAAAITQPATGAIVPQIARVGCPGGRTTLTKVWIYTGKTFCVSGTGSFNPNSWDVSFCAGNAHGHLVGWTETGVRRVLNFAPGNIFWFYAEPGGELHLTNITITSRTGAALCPP